MFTVILGHTPSPRSSDFPRLSFTFWSSCWPLWVAYWGIPPFLGSSGLSQASLSFDLVADPHELSYWGISPSTEFACIVIWVTLWLWAIWSGHSSSCHVNLSRDRTYIDQPSLCHVSSVSGTAPIRSVIIVPVWRPGLCFSMTFRVTFSRFGI